MTDSITPTNEISARLTGYFAETRRPLVCLAFLSPILIAYEVGVLVLKNDASRNGADVLLRGLLDQLGFEFSLLLPIAICLVLLTWHHLSGEAWRLNTQTLLGMAGECVAFGFGLLVFSHLQQSLMSGAGESIEIASQMSATPSLAIGDSFQHFIAYLGAGLYEELLFRLLLLTLFIWIADRLLDSKKQAIVAGVFATSILFVAAHYQPLNPGGYALSFTELDAWYGLSFRFLAGIFFAVLYLRRGFGVAVGAHAAYDLLIHFM